MKTSATDMQYLQLFVYSRLTYYPFISLSMFPVCFSLFIYFTLSIAFSFFVFYHSPNFPKSTRTHSIINYSRSYLSWWRDSSHQSWRSYNQNLQILHWFVLPYISLTISHIFSVLKHEKCPMIAENLLDMRIIKDIITYSIL